MSRLGCLLRAVAAAGPMLDYGSYPAYGGGRSWAPGSQAADRGWLEGGHLVLLVAALLAASKSWITMVCRGWVTGFRADGAWRVLQGLQGVQHHVLAPA